MWCFLRAERSLCSGGIILLQLVTKTLLQISVTSLGDKNTANNVAVITITIMMIRNVAMIKHLMTQNGHVTQHINIKHTFFSA